VVLSNRRGPSSLESVVSALGPLASAGTVHEAASADMVFLAVMWPDIATALSGLPDWDGRVLVDTTNQFDYVDGRLQPVDTVQSFGIATGSEVVASMAPGTGHQGVQHALRRLHRTRAPAPCGATGAVLRGR
jgi:predicted dinucleotide-binding enzyme